MGEVTTNSRTVQVHDLRELLAPKEEVLIIQTDEPEQIDLGTHLRIVRLHEDQSLKVTIIILPEHVRVAALID